MSSSKSEEPGNDDQNQTMISIDDQHEPHEPHGGKIIDQYVLSQISILLTILKIPYVIMQWDLLTRTFDMQYILNLDLGLREAEIKLNNDNTLLAVAGIAFNTFDKSYKSVIYAYSTKSGLMVANSELTNSINDSINIISDYIIKIDTNHLSIQRLSQNEIWKRYIEFEERYFGNTYTYFNKNKIMQFIQTIMEKYKKCKSNQILTQNYQNEQEMCRNDQCPWITWIIEYKKTDKPWDEIQLKAQIESEKEIKEIDVTSFPLYANIENKVLENGDIMLIITTCIQIYTINLVKNSNENITGKLIYCWCFDYFKIQNNIGSASTPKQIIIELLTSFRDIMNLNSGNFGFEILPPPTLAIWFRMSTGSLEFRCLDYKESALLKLYLKDIFYQILSTMALYWGENWRGRINELLTYCYEYCLLMHENDDIYSFRLIIDQIAFILIKLEQDNRNQRYIEKFLSKTNLLVGHIGTEYYHDKNDIDTEYYHFKNDNSLFFNFQHYGTYINLHDLFKSSNYNYMNLSSRNCNLMIPLLNIATYSDVYSYSELLNVQDNSFTLLTDEPGYFKLWNIKAFINFKWNIYGKFYYFIIWAIYSTFMGCFLIASTISEHKISWIDQIILLVSTIFFGFIFFIFEVRQFIHRPTAYIKSAWNWFDLAAILFPIITSLVWLHNITPPIWIITISAFLLEIKFLLFFRALEYFGKYFAITIGVAQKVFSFLVVLGIMVLAFAHSLHLLLRPTSEYSYDQPSYTNDANNPWNLVSTYKLISSNGTVGESSFIETPDDNTNLFSFFSTSVLAVYFMLTGDTSSVSSWILSEIELFWMLPYQRRKKNWFPEILYYKVSVNELKKYVKSFEDKGSLPPKILEISKIDDTEEIQDKIDKALTKIDEALTKIEDTKETLQSKIDEALTNKMNETMSNQLNEILKDPLDKINELIKHIEKKRIRIITLTNNSFE
ncbi:transient receptor potential cation channel subfamily a member 1-like [Gigaspora margarita]|uniref:Transient receptor potential cation channel subfamily a member 1-like n=1 Tax=Gigaspora margarita TaxID=4874 RepID=A0A8H4A6Z3_GIGMA|nr:transient receptor potential cation channel subfamily a member 1-like [Gigaspora margarita]